MRNLPDRYWAKVDKGRPEDCWMWVAGKDASGYGTFKLEGIAQRAHRLAYESLRGPIPAGLVIDHLCRVRACVNPWHMEPVTIRINTMRGEGLGARHAMKDACGQGHSFSAENTRVNKHGARICKTCERAWQAAYYRRKKARST